MKYSDRTGNGGQTPNLRHPGVGRDPVRTTDINKINQINELDPGLRRGDERNRGQTPNLDNVAANVGLKPDLQVCHYLPRRRTKPI
jgi:hypothetical protein